MTTPFEVVLRCPARGGWRLLQRPVAVLEARDPAEVRDCLRSVAREVERTGCIAAGFVTYEAAAAYGFHTHAPPAGALPLVAFGLFPPAHVTFVRGALPCGPYEAGPWVPSIDRPAYEAGVRTIRRHIEAGDAYQVNFTFRLRARFTGDPRGLFVRMHGAQRGRWSAYVDAGRHAICSASPELFFTARDGGILCEPMKGTAPRGRSSDEDRDRALALRRSHKNRAENVMIVDVMRNDLGRIASTGSVAVQRLFDVARYPTVWQMTSRVRARSDAAFPEIVEALFPPASVTGAPKLRAAEIIHALEDSPRGIYTGAIGVLEPGGRAAFNVAIRTVAVDRAAACAEFGVGSGIVWDSDAADEYTECCLKAEVLEHAPPPVELLETLAWTPQRGFELLERHLARLRRSAAYFGLRCDRGAAVAALEESVHGRDAPRRVRLVLDAQGRFHAASSPLPAALPIVRAALAPAPVDPSDVWLYHKTTRRGLYEDARAARPDCDETLLWNRAGELTEGTIANVVVQIGARKVTPPVRCGLLPGTFRAELLAGGQISEGVIRVEDLRRVREFWTINSVRGWQRAVLVD